MTLDDALLSLDAARPLPGAAACMSMAPGYRLEPEFDLADGGWREAAVLILLYADRGTARFPLMLRPSGAGAGAHAGQVSLPGGSRESGESLEACALREAREEIGIDPASVRVVRALSPLAVPPSRFVVSPYVGVVAGRPAYVPSAAEVAALYEPSLDDLLDAAARREDEAPFGGRLWRVPYYRLAGQRVWGATAMILSELEAMLSSPNLVEASDSP